MDALELIIQILLFLAPLALGAKYGPMALIGMSGVSVFILVEFMRLQPGSPPLTAIFIILAVICATAAMTAAGGMEYLVRVATKALKKNPNRIPIIGPLVVWLFTIMSGTGNITFALVPVMYEVSYSSKIRPERVLSTAVAISQLALMASPVAAVTYVYINMVTAGGGEITLAKMLMVTVPASLISTILTSFIMSKRGKSLDEDPEYQRRLKDGEIDPPKNLEEEELEPLPPRAAWSAYIFLGGVIAGVVLGFFEGLRPTYQQESPSGELLDVTVSMGFMIPTCMFAVAGLIMIICKVKTTKVMEQSIIGTGLIAALLLLAVPVLAGTIINAHTEAITEFVGSAMGISVLLFAVILFLLAALIQSQVASLSILVPLAMGGGLAVGPMTGMLGAASANNMLASMSGLGQAAILTDKTGSTRQGSFLLNGSFLVPVLLCVAFAIVVGVIVQAFVF